jgi:hypothetical protein
MAINKLIFVWAVLLRKILTMRQVFLLTTIFILVACGQAKDKKEAILNSNNDTLVQTETKAQLTPAEAPNNDGDNAPVHTALTFINLYVANCNKNNESVDIVEWVNANHLATNRFKTALKTMMEEAYKQDPEIGLGFDPIFDGQDYPDQGFELESHDSQSNFIIVKGKNWDDFKLTLKVVLENNKWLVDGCGIINIPNDKKSKR